MRKLYNSIVLLASAALFHASPLLADVPQTHAPSSGIDSWVKTVNARIDNVMFNPAGLTGTVIALFRLDDDRRATDVEIRGATPAMERIARQTLQRAGRLPALPHGVDRRQRIKLQLLLDDGADLQAYSRKRQTLLAAADQANRRIGGGGAMVADFARNR